MSAVTPWQTWLLTASAVAAGVYVALTLYYLTLDALVILPAAMRLLN